MQCLLKGMKIRCCLFCWVHGYTLIFLPVCTPALGTNPSQRKKHCLFCQLTLQMPLFCACHYLEDLSLRRSDSAEVLLFPPKAWGMPKPLCNLEGIFILPQGQHVFFPGSPTAQAAQAARKINQTSPERTAWSDRHSRKRKVYRPARLPQISNR